MVEVSQHRHKMTVTEHKAKLLKTLTALVTVRPSLAHIVKVAKARVAIATRHDTLLKIDREVAAQISK